MLTIMLHDPVIAIQVIPTRQLLQEPMEEYRAIKFSTNWQQNAGLTLYRERFEAGKVEAGDLDRFLDSVK